MKRLLLLLVVVALAAPAGASADALHFSGRTGPHRHFTCVKDWLCPAPYRISGSVSANIFNARGPGYAAEAAFGIFYSTAALSPDTILIYGFEYRQRGRGWQQACVEGRCLFDSRAQAPWPGNPAGDQYFTAPKLPVRGPRSLVAMRLYVQPFTETAEGRTTGLWHYHEFKVRYRRCTCILPSVARPAPPPEAEPAPPPEAEPAPPPPPAPAPPPPAPPPAKTSARATRPTRAWSASAGRATPWTSATGIRTVTAPTPA